VIARFFNTVGPRQTGRYGMVLPTFVSQALDGVPLTVYGSGKQSRCFGYVGDAVEAMLRLASTDRAVGEVVNIGNDEEITIEELACLVNERTGRASPLHWIPYDQAYEPGFEDMFRRVPSLEKLMRITNYRPHTKLSSIIDMVASDLQRRRELVPVLEPAFHLDSARRVVA
jgi:UDP-glucose 4-epimerase